MLRDGLTLLLSITTFPIASLPALAASKIYSNTARKLLNYSVMAITLSTPLSLYSIPVVWFLAYYPMNLKYRTLQKSGGYNNVDPRGNIARIASKEGSSPEFVARLSRMEGAHHNGNEILPVWAAGVLAGHQVGLDPRTLNIASLLFISLRVAYIYIYINQTTAKQALARTMTFALGLICPMTLLFKAANKARVS